MQRKTGDRRVSLWVLPDRSAPLRHVAAAHDRRHASTEVWTWMPDESGAGRHGVVISLPVGRRRGYPMSVKVVSPTLAVALARHRAADVVVLELDLVTLYAIMSRLLRPRRRVTVLVEGDLTALGPTGSAGWKLAFRRWLARRVDAFAANSTAAARYLTDVLGVDPSRIHVGWWLAGLPDDLPATAPDLDRLGGAAGPAFLAVGQLIPRKGHAELIRAAAAFRRQHGPCRVWIAGDGPDRAALEALAAAEGVGDVTTFLGHVDPPRLRGLLEAADLFVFPTFNDLVGRALVEALSTGTPVVVSNRSGAVGDLVQDGVAGVVVDPEDPAGLAEGLAVAADPGRLAALREGAADVSAVVSVDAAADAVAAATALAREARAGR